MPQNNASYICPGHPLLCSPTTARASCLSRNRKPKIGAPEIRIYDALSPLHDILVGSRFRMDR